MKKEIDDLKEQLRSKTDEVNQLGDLVKTFKIQNEKYKSQLQKFAHTTEKNCVFLQMLEKKRKRENRLHKNPLNGHKSARGPHRRDVTHLSKVSCFYRNPFIFVGYRNDRFFPHTNPYILNVTQQCRCSPMFIFRSWVTCDENVRLFSNILIFEMKNEMFDDSLAFSQPAIAVINGPSRPRFLC